MDPRDFLNTARELLSSASREADLRSAISRAYYCAYHVAWAAVRDGIDSGLRHRAKLDKKCRHDTLIASLRSARDPEVQAAGDALGNLYEERNRADYRHWLTIRQQQVQDAVDGAGAQLAEIDRLTPQKIGTAATPYLEMKFPPVRRSGGSS